MAHFVTVTLSDNRGEVTLNTSVIASVRPATTSDYGALVICVGGAVYRVEDDFDELSSDLRHGPPVVALA